MLRQAQPEIVVLGVLEALVITLELDHGFLAHHDAAVAEAVFLPQPGPEVLIAGQHRDQGPETVILVNPVVGAAHQGVIGMILQELALQLQAVGQREVLGLHDGNKGAPGRVDADVQGLGQTQGLGIGDHPEAAIVEFVENAGGLRIGVIIDNDELEVGISLLENAVNGGLQIRPGMVNRHEDADLGRLDFALGVFADRHGGIPLAAIKTLHPLVMARQVDQAPVIDEFIVAVVQHLPV